MSNPFEFDNRVSFDEDTHTYTVDGTCLDTSVSDVVKAAFCKNEFQPSLIIQENLASWRGKPDSKYHNVVKGLDDEQAKSAILKLWETETNKGTLLHKWAEFTANGVAPYDTLQYMAKEQTQILTGWSILSSKGLKIVRTEHSIFYPPTDPWVGGQIDFLMSTANGYTIVDLKRTDKDLGSNAKSYGRTGTGPMSAYPDNPHMRYSLQQSLYCVMLEALTGKSVNEMYLLQVHPSLSQPNLIPCTDLRTEAVAMLQNRNTALPQIPGLEDSATH